MYDDMIIFPIFIATEERRDDDNIQARRLESPMIRI